MNRRARLIVAWTLGFVLYEAWWAFVASFGGGNPVDGLIGGVAVVALIGSIVGVVALLVRWVGNAPQ